MIRRKYFGWYDPRFRKILLSFYPPDSPSRPAMFFESRQAVDEFVRKRNGRISILWSPELPIDVDQLLQR
jgi:hypothetical protein